MNSRGIMRNAAKYVLGGVSALTLIATTFTTSALAEARESLDVLNSQPAKNQVHKASTNAPGIAQPFQDFKNVISQDINQLFSSVTEEVSSVQDSNSSPLESSPDESRISDVSQGTIAQTNDNAIVIQGDTVIIQGDTSASAIRAATQGLDPQVVNTVLFKNQLTITTDQTNPDYPFKGSKWLQNVKADEGAKVSFAPATGQTNPTLLGFFYGCENLKTIDGLASWDVSNVTGESCMENLFYNCKALASLDALSGWDVSNVTGDYCMNAMFEECSLLTSLDAISAWDVSSVKGSYCMCEMFYDCTSLTSLDGLASWDVSAVTDEGCMDYMFSGCSRLTSLDALSAWDVSSVTDSYCMCGMFAYCTSLISLEGISTWDMSGLTGISCLSEMFEGCSSLTSLDGLAAWNVSDVTGDACMESMFKDCSNLISLDGLEVWNLSKVGGDSCMCGMFEGCSSLTSIDAIASWNIDKAIAAKDGVKDMFDGCSAMASITVGGSNGFKLDASMSLPAANWWPVDAPSPQAYPTTSGDTANLIAQSANTATNGYRWQLSTGDPSPNPMTAITTLTVTWPLTVNLSYTGLLQTVTPTVLADADQLEAGRDFYVTYTNNTTSEVSAVVKNAGTYTAKVNIRGAYTYTGEAQTTQVIVSKLNLNREANPPSVYTVPSVCKYTGNPVEPRTMVRLYLRDDRNPASSPQKPLPDIPIYTYLVENKDMPGDAGDYAVSYTNNVNPGVATATVSPAIPAGLTASNLEGTASVNFRIPGDFVVTFDSNGGTSVPSREVMSGQTITRPEDPRKEGFTFVCWCTDETLTQEFAFGTPITANLTLYAKWQSNPGPTPGPTPEPSPDGEGGLIPTTGDSTNATAQMLILIANILLGVAAIAAASTWLISRRRSR